MSHQAKRTVGVQRAGKLALIALLGASAAGLSGTTSARIAPARAACSGDLHTNVLMNRGRADFGADPHVFGSPTNSGRICWSTGGAILEGQLYYDDLFNQGCAHINVSFRTATGVVVSRYARGVCSTGGLRQESVYSQVNGAITRITIELATSDRANGSGAQTSVGSSTFTKALASP